MNNTFNPRSDAPVSTVLVVDDDPLMRQGIRLLLRDNYRVMEAASVGEGLTLFDSEKPDLVTLDINMPEVDGMEGLDHFRKRSSQTPIILVSGERSFELAQDALRLGATDYLTKPFPPDDLRNAVKSALVKTFHLEGSGSGSSVAGCQSKLRLPLENLKEESFLSLQHRARFFALAQNVLSEKKRTFETISVKELIKTIAIQFDSLHLQDKYRCICSDNRATIECDMYLLGVALANLVLTCVFSTRKEAGPVNLVFETTNDSIWIFLRKANLKLMPETITGFNAWRKQGDATLNAESAMLVLTQKVVDIHHGRLSVHSPGAVLPIVEIILPRQEPI